MFIVVVDMDFLLRYLMNGSASVASHHIALLCIAADSDDSTLFNNWKGWFPPIYVTVADVSCMEPALNKLIFALFAPTSKGVVPVTPHDALWSPPHTKHRAFRGWDLSCTFFILNASQGSFYAFFQPHISPCDSPRPPLWPPPWPFSISFPISPVL